MILPLWGNSFVLNVNCKNRPLRHGLGFLEYEMNIDTTGLRLHSCKYLGSWHSHRTGIFMQ